MKFNERLLICGVKTIKISNSDVKELEKRGIALNDPEFFPPILF